MDGHHYPADGGRVRGVLTEIPGDDLLEVGDRRVVFDHVPHPGPFGPLRSSWTRPDLVTARRGRSVALARVGAGRGARSASTCTEPSLMRTDRARRRQAAPIPFLLPPSPACRTPDPRPVREGAEAKPARTTPQRTSAAAPARSRWRLKTSESINHHCSRLLSYGEGTMTVRVRRSLTALQDAYESGDTKPLEDLMRAWKGIKDRRCAEVSRSSPPRTARTRRRAARARARSTCRARRS